MHLIPLSLPRRLDIAATSIASAAPALPLTALAGRHVVIEALIDGAEVELSFDTGGQQKLSAGGRALAGGFGDRPFIPMKVWAMAHEHRLFAALQDHLELHGVWSYAMRRVWYDSLPHYFHATEVLDRGTNRCWSTARRHALLEGTPVLCAPVLYAGPMPTQPQWLESLLRRPVARTAGWRRAFEAAALRDALPMALWASRCPPAQASVSLIVKVEDERHVLARFRLVNAEEDDTTTSMPVLLPNALAPGADLFAAKPAVDWRDLGLKPLRGLGALKTLSVEALEQRCA